MKNYFKSVTSIIRKAVFEDKIDLYLIIASILIFLLSYFIWKASLERQDIFVFVLNGLYPIKYLFIVMLVNTFLAIFSYDKEKEIGYLLHAANIFIGSLVLILEIFYLINIKNV